MEGIIARSERDEDSRVGVTGCEGERTADRGGLGERGCAGPTGVFREDIARGVVEAEQRCLEGTGDAEVGEAGADGADEYGALAGARDGESGEEGIVGGHAGAGREIREASEAGRAGGRREERSGDGLFQGTGVGEDAETSGSATGGRDAGGGGRRVNGGISEWEEFGRQQIGGIQFADRFREAGRGAATTGDDGAGADVEVGRSGLGGDGDLPRAGGADAGRSAERRPRDGIVGAGKGHTR